MKKVAAIVVIVVLTLMLYCFFVGLALSTDDIAASLVVSVLCGGVLAVTGIFTFEPQAKSYQAEIEDKHIEYKIVKVLDRYIITGGDNSSADYMFGTKEEAIEFKNMLEGKENK